MPYFVYRVTRNPLLQLEKLALFDMYPDASRHAKAARTDIDPAKAAIKVIHAETELHAEDLLSQVREARPGSGAEE
ncbi:MAG: hypothetical protein ABI790_07945 [Betaproteobacteria bacterium]